MQEIVSLICQTYIRNLRARVWQAQIVSLAAVVVERRSFCVWKRANELLLCSSKRGCALCRSVRRGGVDRWQ